jgi:hypothetical protein
MAIVLTANYSKKVGLPEYSSHQYCLTLQTEVAELSQVATESARLHAILQSSVDHELQSVGYLPGKANRNGQNKGNGVPPRNDRNGHPGQQNGNASQEIWNCSAKQKQYILDLVEQHQLDKNKVEVLAQERFGKSVRGLNKLEASGLIEELKEQIANNPNSRKPSRANQPTGVR